MGIIKPKKLKPGDVIGIISPASSPDDLTKINSGVQYLEKLGYRVEVGKNVGSHEGYLAGSDAQRLTDLHEMFKNKQIKAIFSIRGGYGSGRLLIKLITSSFEIILKFLLGTVILTHYNWLFLLRPA